MNKAYKLLVQEPFDFDEHEKFQEQVNNALNNGETEIEIDLSAVDNMDSSAIGMLIVAYKNSDLFGSTIKVVGANKLVYEMLYLTQLDKLFKIEKSIKEGVYNAK